MAGIRTCGIRGMVVVVGVAAGVAMTVGGTTRAGIIHVSPGESIQAAIDAASDGDEIIVAPGTYNEAIDFVGKSIRLHSSDGPEVTTIDAAGFQSTVVRCAHGEGRGTTLQGFTLTNGEPSEYYNGGGMSITFSSPRVSDCIFRTNTGLPGGGICAYYAHPTVTDCVFEGNTGRSYGGGGIYVEESSLTVSGCTFIANETEDYGGGLYNRESDVLITNCYFRDNWSGTHGGGIYTMVTDPVILNCTFEGNSSDIDGGALYNEYRSSPQVVNCLFRNNTAARQGGAIHTYAYGVPVFIGCTIVDNTAVTEGGGISGYDTGLVLVYNCVIWGNEPDEIHPNGWWANRVMFSDIRGGWNGVGWNNIDADPLFVDPAGGDYRLGPGSPCIDAGDNDAVPADVIVDLYGNPRFLDEPCVEDTGEGSAPIVDMGAFEHEWVFIDCNENGVRDQCDIYDGVSPDQNANGIPDECEAGYYTGPSGGSWFDPANWTGGTVPTSEDEVTVSSNVLIDQPGAVALTVGIMNGGSITFAGGSLSTECVDLGPDAGIDGAGSITGDVYSRGTISPGSPIGSLVIDGDFTQTKAGILNTEIAGTEPGQEHDLLDITGAAALDGKIVITVVDGYLPDCYAEFELLSYALQTGEFAEVEFPGMPDALARTVDYMELTMRLTVWPFVLEDTKLIPSDGYKGGGFGASAAISGGLAVVGAVPSANEGYDYGAAYAYVLQDDGAWHQTRLWPLAGEWKDYYGSATAVSGNVVIVGACGALGKKGKVWVFRYLGSSWTRVKLTAFNPQAYDEYGSSVDIDGDVAIAGIPGDDDDGEDSGSAMIHRYDGAEWDTIKIKPNDGAEDNHFGTSVAIQGDVAAVGAGGDDVNGPMSGSAYVFRYNGEEWVQKAKLLPSDGTYCGRFGCSIAMSGEVILVGAYGADSERGAAYVFRYNGSNWVEEAILTPSDGLRGDYFGYDLDLDGDTAIISRANINTNFNRPEAACIYRYDGSEWVPGPRLMASDISPYDCFGGAVGISGDQAVIGARWDDDNGADSGAAYMHTGLFEDCNQNGYLDSCDILAGVSEDWNDNGIPDECECIGDVNNSGIVDEADILAVLSVWGTCDDCPEDVNIDGVVDIDDVFAVLAYWGPCT